MSNALTDQDYENIAATLEDDFLSSSYSKSIKNLVCRHSGNFHSSLHEFIRCLHSVDEATINYLKGTDVFSNFKYTGTGNPLSKKELYKLLRKWYTHSEHCSFDTWIVPQVRNFLLELADYIIDRSVY